MNINIQEFLNEAEINEAFYPGKRIVHACRQEGEFKSHCIVLDWRNPDKIKIEIKAGISGKNLEPKRLKYYPVSFQSPTYVDIEVVNDNNEDEEETGSASGKGGSGGKGHKKKKSLSDLKNVAFEAFGEVIDKAAPSLGRVVDMMIAGTKIAADLFGSVMAELAHQVNHGKVMATELLSKAGDFVTKVEPPKFMKPKGDETVKYQYNAEKNADIGFQRTM